MIILLTKEREKRGWSRTKLGYKSKIPPAQIGQIELGNLRPCPAYSRRLEKVFGIPCDKLLAEAGDQDERESHVG